MRVEGEGGEGRVGGGSGSDDEFEFEFVGGGAGVSDTDSEDVPAGALTTHINIGCVSFSFQRSTLHLSFSVIVAQYFYLLNPTHPFLLLPTFYNHIQPNTH